MSLHKHNLYWLDEQIIILFTKLHKEDICVVLAIKFTLSRPSQSSITRHLFEGSTKLHVMYLYLVHSRRTIDSLVGSNSYMRVINCRKQ